jgi:flagellin
LALTVNTNIASLTAQRNLTGSQSDLSTSLQRLSSGLRINSAKDDAAGLAISERFTAQIRGINQGVRNANDGISLAQTAEGALKEVTNNLQRIRELAVQSANATNSASDRTALQAEVAQLVAEIDRVAQNTKFNGVALLDGTFTSKAFQIGADITDTVSISAIASARTSAIGGTSSATATGAAAVDANAIVATSGNANALVINNTLIGASTSDGVSTTGDTYSALSKANAINALSSTTGVTATATTTLTSTVAANGNAASSFTLNNVLVSWDNSDATASNNAAALETALNALTSQTGVTAEASGASITLTAADGRNISIADNSDGTGAANSGLADATTTRGSLTLTSGSASGIQVGNTVDGGALSNNVSGFTTNNSTAATGSGVAVSSLSVTTADNASSAITSIDNALSTINSTRATLGSYQSRFESIVASSQTTAENLSASRSRIVDADFASETAQLTKAQILQQSGIAMLAQANAIPQNVLALLQ